MPRDANAELVRWPAPRGPRAPGSRSWESRLWDRQQVSFSGKDEVAAVGMFRDLTEAITRARGAQGLSLRKLGERAGVPTSVVAGLEQGSSWGRIETFERLTAALGLEMTVDGQSDVRSAITEATHLRARRDREQHRMLIAESAGITPKTLYYLSDPTRSPSMSTVFTMVVWLGARFEVETTTNESVVLYTSRVLQCECDSWSVESRKGRMVVAIGDLFSAVKCGKCSRRLSSAIALCAEWSIDGNPTGASELERSDLVATLAMTATGVELADLPALTNGADDGSRIVALLPRGRQQLAPGDFVTVGEPENWWWCRVDAVAEGRVSCVRIR